jgi:hypothetical protein
VRKHNSGTTTHYAEAWRKLDQLRLARIDAAVVEYAELGMDLDNIDFNDIDRRIADAKRGGFPPIPKWQEKLREERQRR